MRMVFTIILIIILIVLVYYTVFCSYAMMKPILKYPVCAKKHKFAILIPARNEEAVIGNLIQSLQEQNYPKDEYEIDVLINGCTDGTEKIVLEHGAKVLHFSGTHSKGEVLKQTFVKLVKDTSIDAFLVLDADNLAHPDFLTKMNDAYGAGYRLVQGRRTGKNKCSTHMSSSYEVFYIMQNVYYNHAHTAFSLSSSLNGTAILLARSYIAEYGYEMHTLTEDLELMAIAAMQKEKIGYAHEAIVYDEYPETIRVAFRQLKRWIFGQIQCMRLYSGKMWKNAIKTRCSTFMDIGWVFDMPLIGFVVLILFIWWMVSDPVAASFIGRNILWILLFLYVIMLGVLNTAITKNHSSKKELARGVMYFPVFAILWFILAPVMLFKKNVKWEPITHNVSKRIEEMK